MNRRDFLKWLAVGAASVAVGKVKLPELEMKPTHNEQIKPLTLTAGKVLFDCNGITLTAASAAKTTYTVYSDFYAQP